VAARSPAEVQAYQSSLKNKYGKDSKSAPGVESWFTVVMAVMSPLYQTDAVAAVNSVSKYDPQLRVLVGCTYDCNAAFPTATVVQIPPDSTTGAAWNVLLSKVHITDY
jgi:hypothetical protein